MCAAERPRSSRQFIRRSLLLGFLLLFPLSFNYYSPVLPVMGALEGVATFSLLLWATWLVTSLALGRAACGWICPLGALQELWAHAAGRRARRVRWLAPLRFVLFALWVGVVAWALVRGGGLREIELLYQTENVVSWDGVRGAFIYAGMFGLVMLVALPLGRRAFCRHMCWWGPLNVLGERAGRRIELPVLGLSQGDGACRSCGRCAEACPAGLEPRRVAAGAAERIDCVACGSCADACDQRAPRLGFGRR